MELFDKLFHLKENGTNVKTEVIAGITTFMAMAYILAVNPDILSAAGMDKGAVFTATALAAFVATLMMAIFSNYPFALAPGMGLNAYFAFTVCGQMGYSWHIALTAVFLEGIIFILLSLTSVREGIFNAIPMNLKHAVTAGIGLFIAFIGLQNANIVVSDGATLVKVFSLKAAAGNGTMNSVGIGVLLALLGVLLTGILLAKKIKGNILWGILITWIIAMILEVTGVYVPNPEAEMYSVIPSFAGGFHIPSILPTLGKLDFSGIATLEFAVVVFAFLFVDLFDTLGTLIGVSTKANMLDKEGKLPRMKGALMADAVGTTVGAVFGTSTTTTFVESAAGVSEGGRTGLTGIVTALLFGVSLFLSPVFLSVPSFATAPALIIVGFLMTSSILKINFDDITEALPCFICFIAMPLLYSISEGIALGVISYVLINLLTGKAGEKKITIIMYILAVLFVLKYIMI